MYATCTNFNEVSRQLGVPVTTIKGWIEKKKPDAFDELRTQKKAEFIEKSSEILDKLLLLLDRRVTTALIFEEELDRLLEMISKQNEISDKEKKTIVMKLKEMQLQKIGELSTVIGTLYDKRALAKGESTENTKITFSLPEELSDYAK